MAEKVDVIVSNEGTIFLFTPLTQEAKEWVEDRVTLEDHQWLGDSFAVDHRYAYDLAEGMVEAGLILE